MDHQRPHYLKLKGKTFYYSRRVPKELQQYSKTARFETCLHTVCRSRAAQQAALLTRELDDQWSILRRRSRNELIGRLFGTAVSKADPSALAKDSPAPLLSNAVETYVKLKATGRSQTFEAGARRSTGYLIHICGDKRIDTFVRSDANAFRDYLKGRGLSKDSISRNFTNVRAIVNFVLREEGLQPTAAFSGVFIGDAKAPKKRYVPTSEELIKLQSLCREYDDELRWILGLICNTGLRLSEAVGLARNDVVLIKEVPHLIVRPHPWRGLKTHSSEREVPLVGVSLWAAQRALNCSNNTFVFPRYANANSLRSNSASASLNKWLKQKINREIVIHSLRHAIRDRLRSVECPPEIIDSIGGWQREGIGESYGLGFNRFTTHKWLVKCESVRQGSPNSLRS